MNEPTPWERLQLVRDPSRPAAPAIFDALLDDAFELHGDRSGGDDLAVVVRLGSLGGRRIVAIGQNRERIRPAGFRKAVRALRLAGRLGLPVLTLIDTRGADPTPASEAGGVATAIAETFEAMLSCPSPTLALLSGEGGSGGALAMAVADRVLALSNAVFSVIAPEGAAAILYRDAARAPELAARLKITAPDLEAFALVDRLISEEPGVWTSSMQDLIAGELDTLAAAEPTDRLARRAERWREAGSNILAL
jgi:acetyl-CoA carboxylase carboxyl transferase alpha subunit